jgi:hypothetical protein
MTHSISTKPPQKRYVVCGPTSSPDEPLWIIIDTQATQPGSKIVEYVKGRANAIRRAEELTSQAQ